MIWRNIIQQYKPTFLGQCQQAIDWTNTFVTDQLKSVMFNGDPEAQAKADKIVQLLRDADEHKAHARHIPASKCIEMGLRVKMMEEDNKLQDLILTLHHCYMHTLMNSPAYKIIENHLGTAFIKNQIPQANQQ
ncbi:MAG TPA: hypothetical protein VM120_24105 [Bryobacteraceae bacterium]|nr:hypothetical protein [Bryobacteraceae bacterium]